LGGIEERNLVNTGGQYTAAGQHRVAFARRAGGVIELEKPDKKSRKDQLRYVGLNEGSDQKAYTAKSIAKIQWRSYFSRVSSAEIRRSGFALPSLLGLRAPI
jgi:hypothetical protein